MLSSGVLIVLTASFHFYRTMRPRPPSSQRQTDRSSASSLAGYAYRGRSRIFIGRRRVPSVPWLCSGSPNLQASRSGRHRPLLRADRFASIGSAIQLSAHNYDGALLLQLVAGGVLGAPSTGSLLAGQDRGFANASGGPGDARWYSERNWPIHGQATRTSGVAGCSALYNPLTHSPP